MGAKLLQDVRQDLADVVQVCEGKKKQTNYLRTLINELVKGAQGGCMPGGRWSSVLTRPRPSALSAAVPPTAAGGPPWSTSSEMSEEFSFY